MLFSISEILKKADNAKTADDKIKVLQTFQNKTLIDILGYAFDPKFKFLLPPGKMEYQKNRTTESQTVLYNQIKKMYIFLENDTPPNLTQARREILFRELLSSVDSADAELLVCVKDKKLPYKSITKSIVLKAFPGLFANE